MISHAQYRFIPTPVFNILIDLGQKVKIESETEWTGGERFGLKENWNDFDDLIR